MIPVEYEDYFNSDKAKQAFARRNDEAQKEIQRRWELCGVTNEKILERGLKIYNEVTDNGKKFIIQRTHWTRKKIKK